MHGQRPVEEVHSLDHAGQSQVNAVPNTGFGGRRVEAAPVVEHGHRELVATAGDGNARVPCAAVLADVRQRLLNDPRDGHPLRGRQVVEVAGQFEFELDRGAGGEGLDLLRQNVGERRLHEGPRLQRVGEVA